jgi:hypothetical protein
MRPNNPSRYDDGKRYVIQNRDGEYFQKFEATGWDTVKVQVHWTRDRRKAAVWSMPELLAPGSGYNEALIAGYADTRLLWLDGDNLRPLTPPPSGKVTVLLDGPLRRPAPVKPVRNRRAEFHAAVRIFEQENLL